MITPKWILDSVLELDLRHPYADADSGETAALLAAELLQRLPQEAMLSLAEVACARAALDGSDIQQCAADLVKSIVEVLAVSDTEVMSLTALLGEAWTTLNQLGVPLGDDGRMFSLVDRIKWLDSNRRDAWHERDRADDRAADLERNDANRALAERDRVSMELAQAIKTNRHLREENQRLISLHNAKQIELTDALDRVEAENAMLRAAAEHLRDANVQIDNLQTRVGDLIEIAQATKALQAEGWDFRSKTMDRLLDALAKVKP